MATTPKVLGQLAPGAATLTDLYTVPGATNTTVSSIMAANRSAVDSAVRISVAIAGAADTVAQYLYYDINIPGNDTFTATVGLTLAATDVIRVETANATVSFNAFGIEEA